MNLTQSNRNMWTQGLDSFDAWGIFDKFGSIEWGEYLIREAHLSQRFVFDENRYFHCCAALPVPEEMQVTDTFRLKTLPLGGRK